MQQQLIFKFPFKTTYDEKDYFVSSNNFEVYKLIESWPSWPDKSLNIYGPKGCGKTHLINILRKKIKILYYKLENLDKLNLNKLDSLECIVIDDFNKYFNEEKLYSLLNHIKQLDKFIILCSRAPIKNTDIKLIDLKSRLNSKLIILLFDNANL